MSIETINTAIGAATLFVIGITAIAATIQLHHLRTTNELSALMRILEDWKSEDLQRWFRYARIELPERLRDARYLDELRTPSPDRTVHIELNMCDYWEQIGTYVRFGLLDKKALLNIAGFTVRNIYESLEPCIEAARETSGEMLYENFEYLAVEGALYTQRYSNGRYPARFPRFRQLSDEVRKIAL